MGIESHRVYFICLKINDLEKLVSTVLLKGMASKEKHCSIYFNMRHTTCNMFQSGHHSPLVEFWIVNLAALKMNKATFVICHLIT